MSPKGFNLQDSLRAVAPDKDSEAFVATQELQAGEPEPPAPAAEMSAEMQSAQSEPARVVKPTRSRRPAARKPKAAEPAEAELANFGVVIFLPEPLDRRLSAYRASTKKGYHTLLFDAIESTYSRLPELIREATGRSAETPEVVLFNRSRHTDKRIVDPSENPQSKRHTIRMTESNRQILSDLTEQFEAPSRNFLIVTALDAFLPPA